MSCWSTIDNHLISRGGLSDAPAVLEGTDCGMHPHILRSKIIIHECLLPFAILVLCQELLNFSQLLLLLLHDRKKFWIPLVPGEHLNEFTDNPLTTIKFS